MTVSVLDESTPQSLGPEVVATFTSQASGLGLRRDNVSLRHHSYPSRGVDLAIALGGEDRLELQHARVGQKFG